MVDLIKCSLSITLFVLSHYFTSLLLENLGILVGCGQVMLFFSSSSLA